MIVSELIEKLKKVSQDATVYTEKEGCWNLIEATEVEEEELSLTVRMVTVK